MNNPILFLKHFMRFIPEHKRLEYYPPYWMMRLKVLHLSEDWRHVEIKLPLTWIAKNMGGAMFGGFQASLADPIAPLACAKAFPSYDVWTRHLSIDFRLPGNSDLILKFNFSQQQYELIQIDLLNKGRSTPSFVYGLYREDGKLCTEVTCTVAIREKNYLKQQTRK